MSAAKIAASFRSTNGVGTLGSSDDQYGRRRMRGVEILIALTVLPWDPGSAVVLDFRTGLEKAFPRLDRPWDDKRWTLETGCGASAWSATSRFFARTGSKRTYCRA